MKTLQAATISEDNYFNNLLGNDIVMIAKDIRNAHSKDADTGRNLYSHSKSALIPTVK